MDRRNFLKTSAWAAAGLATAALPKPAHAAPVVPNHFIFVNLGGGWDSCYSIDPKPGMATVSQPPGQLLTYGNLNVWDWKPQVVTGGVPSPASNVKTFFNNWASEVCIVHGVELRSISHQLCAQRVYCGKQGGTSPDMPTIIGFEKHVDMPVPYLVINGPGWAGPLGAAVGRVGETGQLRYLIDPSQANFLSFRLAAQDEADIEALHLANAERERAIRGSAGYNQARINDFEASLARADKLRDKGKGLTFGGGLQGEIDTVIQAFQLGLAGCAMIDSGYGFDTHSNNKSQGPSQDGVFAGLNYLANKLSTTPGSTTGSVMLDETCVVVLSEMTRTPMLNGAQGKDHWPVGSSLLFGAGVNKNVTVGATGEGMIPMPMDITTGSTTTGNLQNVGTEMFAAGVLTLAGVDSTKYFQSYPPVTAIIGP